MRRISANLPAHFGRLLPEHVRELPHEIEHASLTMMTIAAPRETFSAWRDVLARQKNHTDARLAVARLGRALNAFYETTASEGGRRRYWLYDEFSGLVWGPVHATGPKEACIGFDICGGIDTGTRVYSEPHDPLKADEDFETCAYIAYDTSGLAADMPISDIVLNDPRADVTVDDLEEHFADRAQRVSYSTHAEQERLIDVESDD